jgi:hypothetical protein
MLVIEPTGAAGAHALACVLGLPRLEPIERSLERPEWVDVVAKSRGMMHAGVLYRFPVLRAFCGCHLRFDAAGGDERRLASLVVQLCNGHAPPDAGVVAIGYLYAPEEG